MVTELGNPFKDKTYDDNKINIDQCVNSRSYDELESHINLWLNIEKIQKYK